MPKQQITRRQKNISRLVREKREVNKDKLKAYNFKPTVKNKKISECL